MPPESLPRDAQRELLKAKISAGCVLYLHCDFIYNPAYKFVVVVAIDYDYEILLVFLINSRIHPILNNNPDLRRCQVEIHPDPVDYSYLDRISYINCTQIFDDLDIDEVVDYVLATPTSYKGELKDNELNSIVEAVKNTMTISEDDKELIFEYLNS